MIYKYFCQSVAYLFILLTTSLEEQKFWRSIICAFKDCAFSVKYLKILCLTLFLRFGSRSLIVLSFRCICIVHSEFIFVCYEVWIKAAVTAFVVVCAVLTFQLAQHCLLEKDYRFSMKLSLYLCWKSYTHTHTHIFIYASICLHRSISGLISLSINVFVSLFANATVFIIRVYSKSWNQAALALWLYFSMVSF